LLQHDVNITDLGAIPGNMEQQRCRYVVGQVADHAQPIAERGEVEPEHIGGVHGQARRELVRERGGEIAVDFDGVHFIHCGEQRARQRAQPGSDFDDAVGARRAYRSDDRGNDAGVNQEVLAEAFARLVLQEAARTRTCSVQVLPRASAAAMLTAASRLPESALPLAASSSAVPWSTEVRMIGSPSVTFTPLPKLAYLSTGSPWS